MTLEEFVSLVWNMRDAQKDYFFKRTRDALIRAQNLERQVDAEVLRQKKCGGAAKHVGIREVARGGRGCLRLRL